MCRIHRYYLCVGCAHTFLEFSTQTINNYSYTINYMTIVQAQKLVDEWINKFEEGYWPPLSMLASLTEEVGELAREINHREKIKKKKETELKGDLGMELADVLFSLICIANYYEIDLNFQLSKVMDKYSVRDKDRWTVK